MPFTQSYSTISLDSIANSATYFSGLWSPDLKRNQSQQVLVHLINKFYGVSKGIVFHAKVQASHAALGASLDLSRVWICQLVAKLREAKWIETYAPRKPKSKYQEVTVFRPGKMLKRLLIMLRESHQRKKSPTTTVKGHEQKIPSSSVLEPKQTDKQTNCPIPSGFLEGLGEKMSMLKKINW